MNLLQKIPISVIFISLISFSAFGQAAGDGTGTLRGTVTLGDSGKPIHNAIITILQLKRSVDTDDNGSYEFTNLPPGKYDVVAHLDRVPDIVRTVDLTSGEATVDFKFELTGVREEVTVTATGTEQALSSSIQSVDVLGSIELAKKSPVSLGEALDGELGIAKRSFGPGTARPVIRGFDGDRVLVLQDGNRVGGLGFESGDHAEPVDVLTAERVEVVKGPATLLYGSNAIGGVVNTVSGHDSPHKGSTVSDRPGQHEQRSGRRQRRHRIRHRSVANVGKFRRSEKRRLQHADRPRREFVFARSQRGRGIWFYPKKAFFSFNYNFNKRATAFRSIQTKQIRRSLS